VSSIRPLATITLLALVGAFLYLKINETEPQLPGEIADWEMPAELDISESPDMPSFDDSPIGAAPVATGSAPAFDHRSSPPSSPPPFQPQTAGTDGPSIEPSTGSSTNAANLPPLPAVPAAESTAAPATAEASPPVEVSLPVHDAQPVAAPSTQASLYSERRLEVQAALDRGELSQALLMLSDWYGDPSLSPAETQEVDQLLSQLAGSVIYSTEHRLEPRYMVQADESLQDIAKKFEVSWQLLAKINGLSSPEPLQPGQQLKVVQGPFSAVVDLSQRRLTLKLDRRYAGQFAIDVDPTTSVEEGYWAVNQKLITPGNVGLIGSLSTTPSNQKSIIMTNSSGESSQIAILRSANGTASSATDPAGRVIRLKTSDVEDVYDILSLGSKVIIRR
jgi:LysM repeat protein